MGVVLGNPRREIKRPKQHLIRYLCVKRALVSVSLVFVEPFKGKSQMHHMRQDKGESHKHPGRSQ